MYFIHFFTKPYLRQMMGLWSLDLLWVACNRGVFPGHCWTLLALKCFEMLLYVIKRNMNKLTGKSGLIDISYIIISDLKKCFIKLVFNQNTCVSDHSLLCNK